VSRKSRNPMLVVLNVIMITIIASAENYRTLSPSSVMHEITYSARLMRHVNICSVYCFSSSKM
jgi:hypothetical protein